MGEIIYFVIRDSTLKSDSSLHEYIRAAVVMMSYNSIKSVLKNLFNYHSMYFHMKGRPHVVNEMNPTDLI